MQEEKEEAEEEEEETKQEWRRKGNVRLQQVELLRGAGSSEGVRREVTWLLPFARIPPETCQLVRVSSGRTFHACG